MAEKTFPTDTPTTSQITSDKTIDFTSWCARCASLPLLDLFNRKIPPTIDEILICELSSSALLLRNSTCPLCILFGTVAHPFYTQEGTQPYNLVLLPPSLVFARMSLGDIFFKTNVLSVETPDTQFQRSHLLGLIDLKSDHLALGNNFGVRLLERDWFDLPLAKYWLDYCRSKHTAWCSIETHNIASFCVIDCKTRSVIKAPRDCQYVALSYVWGVAAISPDGSVSSSALSNAPKLITDAMDVTEMLGFEYLWVDRYCIDQSDVESKHDQIRQMDVIYSSAQLTIIAVDHDDPNHGLPGVNGTSRTHQPNLQIGSHKLVSSLQTPYHVVRPSKWSKRGWTYQEGLLSLRRLVFSNEQVFFDCAGMQCSETLHVPLDLMHDQETGRFNWRIPQGGFALKDIGRYWDIVRYIREFTQRKLSFPTDSINAIRGIFHVFEKTEYPVFHLTGVPIMPPYAYKPWKYDYYEKSMLIQRSPEACFLVGIFWWHQTTLLPCSRQTCFPSWSWAGWDQPVMDSLLFGAGAEICDFNAEVWVEMPDGSLSHFPQEHSSLPAFIAEASDPFFVRITAKTSECDIFYGVMNPEHNPRSYFHAVLTGDEKILISLKFYPDLLVNATGPDLISKVAFPLGQEKLTALIIAPHTTLNNIEWNLKVLILQEKEDETGTYFERVGVCDFCNVEDWSNVNARREAPKLPFLSNQNAKDVPGERPTAHQKEFLGWFERKPTRTIRLG